MNLLDSGKSTILLGEAAGQALPSHNLRGTLSYNEWVGKNACLRIQNALKAGPDIILVDRGLLDFRFWNYFYEQTGKATHEDVKKVQSQEPFNNKSLIPDLFVAVTVSLDEALRRNPSLSKKTDWVLHHNKCFGNFYNSYKGRKTNLDTTLLSKSEVLSESLKLINSSIPDLFHVSPQDTYFIDK